MEISDGSEMEPIQFLCTRCSLSVAAVWSSICSKAILFAEQTRNYFLIFEIADLIYLAQKGMRTRLQSQRNVLNYSSKTSGGRVLLHMQQPLFCKVLFFA